jgi:hypothetical protein
MQLNNKTIQEFQGIWTKEFKEEITDKEANKIASNFLNLLIAVYKPNKNHEITGEKI